MKNGGFNGRTFGKMHLPGTPDNNKPLLRTSSNPSDADSEILYLCSASASSPDTVNAEAALASSPLPIGGQSGSSVNELCRNTNTTHFYRPLPLRSYEVKAPSYRTIRAQNGASYEPARPSTENAMLSRGKVTLAVAPVSRPRQLPLPPRSCVMDAQAVLHSDPTTTKAKSSRQFVSTTGDMSSEANPREDFKRRDSVEDNSKGGVSQHTSLASALTAFPIPSMQSPIGELPMSISRATSPPERPDTPKSVTRSHRALSEAHITQLLLRTRNQGAQLPLVNWDALCLFERTWREVNEPLLAAIYGRKDVVLSAQDVQYVDCIARELRVGSSAGEWVRELFQRNP